MTDWTKQAEDMIQTWVDAQKKLRDSWLEAMQGLGGPQSKEVWAKATSAWEESIKRVFEAQSEWLSLWAANFTSKPNTSSEVAEWAKQGQEMMGHWAEAQKRLWESWFEMVKKIDPSQLSGTWDKDAGQNLIKAWQENTQKVLDSQAEWVRRWASMGPSDKTPKK